jgi:hypothetical protein
MQLVSKKSDKPSAPPIRATDSAVATAGLFASEKIAAAIGRVQWSGRDNPCWPLPRPDRKGI